MKTALIALALSLTTLPALADFSGHCVAVHDGDTITVVHDSVITKIRLANIDAPELDQEYGPESKAMAEKFVLDKDVFVEDKGVDLYGRTIGIVHPGGREHGQMNQSMVSLGWAWWFRKYDPRDAFLSVCEKSARETKSGIWQDKNAIAPWDFRKLKRERSVQAVVLSRNLTP